MYVKISNEQVETYPYSIGQFRKDNPNISFPKAPTPEQLASWGVYPVTQIDRPQIDHTKNISEGVPLQVNGARLQHWLVVHDTADEMAGREANAWS